MKNRLLLPTLLLRGAALLAPLPLAGMVGCAAAEPHEDLTLHCAGQDKSFTERFSRAYVSRDRDGDIDIVLVDSGTEQQLDRAGSGADPSAAPVWQVMHLKVLWNPKRDQKGDHSVASNATVHWYVVGNTPATRADVLEYAGTAFVVMDDSEPAELSIRNATVRPVACRGDLQDPVGPATLSGTVRATTDRHRVRAALASVRTAVSGALARPESPSSSAR